MKWKFSLTLFVLATLLIFSPAAIKNEVDVPITKDHHIESILHSTWLDAYANYISAIADYKKAIIEERLSWAKRNKIVADTELVRINIDIRKEDLRLIKVRNKILIDDFNRLSKSRVDQDNLISNIKLWANLCKSLKSGKTHEGTWIGLQNFYDEVIPPAILQKSLFRPVKPICNRYFISNDGGDTRHFRGGNMGELLVFLKNKNYSTKQYGKAHREILIFLDNLVRPIEKETHRYENMTVKIN